MTAKEYLDRIRLLERKISAMKMRSEEYDRLSSMSYGEVDKEIKNNLSDSIICGYGYYGHDLLEENGMYFIGTTTGNSCD